MDLIWIVNCCCAIMTGAKKPKAVSLKKAKAPPRAEKETVTIGPVDTLVSRK